MCQVGFKGHTFLHVDGGRAAELTRGLTGASNDGTAFSGTLSRASIRCKIAKMETREGAATVVAGDSVLDFSRLSLSTLNVDHLSDERRRDTRQLYLNYNRLAALPSALSFFCNLEFLDISNNGLSAICEGITRLTRLRTLIAKNNRLDEFSLPKDFGSLQLEVLNLSGNRFEEIPLQCMKLVRLQSLSLGGNRLKSIPAEIENLTRWVTVGGPRARPDGSSGGGSGGGTGVQQRDTANWPDTNLCQFVLK